MGAERQHVQNGSESSNPKIEKEIIYFNYRMPHEEL